MNEPFAILYDLRDDTAWARARQHRQLWGRLYTDIHAVDNDHVVLVFRPSPNFRWRAWEMMTNRPEQSRKEKRDDR